MRRYISALSPWIILALNKVIVLICNILTWNHCNVIIFVIAELFSKFSCMFLNIFFSQQVRTILVIPLPLFENKYWGTRVAMSLKYQRIRSKISKSIVSIHTFLGQVRVNYSKYTNSPSFPLTVFVILLHTPVKSYVVKWP